MVRLLSRLQLPWQPRYDVDYGGICHDLVNIGRFRELIDQQITKAITRTTIWANVVAFSRGLQLCKARARGSEFTKGEILVTRGALGR